jgi:hypothetical protein
MSNLSSGRVIASQNKLPSPGPYTARIIGYLDSTYMGLLEVEILRETGNSTAGGELRQVRYLSPFFGRTSATGLKETNDFDPKNYDNTQKSYGMWMIPPDVGSLILCIFVDGEPDRGYYLGSIPDENMNFMVPGIAATNNVLGGDTYTRYPVAEYNKTVHDTTDRVTQIVKPKHLFADVLSAQGLLADDIRGLTTSSARREFPSQVFGISTPGPIDKRVNAPRTGTGKSDSRVPNAATSRLSGSTFVMDDGDDKFIRKTAANAGPPEYESIEALDKDAVPTGDVTIPHNDLIRLRTRTGHQILLHNSEDLIYIGNAKGTTWIELSSDGKIDIFAKDSISVHTKADMNFYADRDINMEAGRNINMKATSGRVQVESKTDLNLIIGANGVITTAGSLQVNTTGLNNFTSTGATNIKSSAKINLASGTDTNIKAGAKLTQNAAAYYSLPGGGGIGAVTAVASTASTASALSTFDNVYNATGDKISSIMKRIPNIEPWPQHEHLDPLFMTTSETDRENPEAVSFTANPDNQLVPKYYNSYTTGTDTFDPPPPPAN